MATRIPPSTSQFRDANSEERIRRLELVVNSIVSDKQDSLGFTAENVANKKTVLTDNSDTYYPTQKCVKTAVDAKQDSLGFTAENVANKDTTTTLGTSDTKYPSQKAVKTYVDSSLPRRATMLTNSALAVVGGVVTLVLAATQRLGFYCRQASTHANGDSASSSFTCQADTYSIQVLYVTHSAAGKIDYAIDGVNISTGNDHYTAGVVYNNVLTISGIVLTAGYHKLTWTVNGKNAASTSYYWDITSIDLIPSTD